MQIDMFCIDFIMKSDQYMGVFMFRTVRLYAYQVLFFILYNVVYAQEPLLWFDNTKTYEEIVSSVGEYYQQYGRLSQSDAHMLKRIDKNHYDFIVKELTNVGADAQKQIGGIIASERSFNKQGGYVLYHATKPEHYALHYIDTKIYLLYQKKLKRLTRFVAPRMLILRQCIPLDPNPKETLRNFRKPPLKLGEQPSFIQSQRFSDYYDLNPEVRQALLSCNGSLFGNIHMMGACTFAYWIQKGNCSTHTWDFEQWIKKYASLEQLLQCKRQAFEAVVAHFCQASKTGVLLQLCFKNKSLLDKTSYISQYYGYGYKSFMVGNSAITKTSAMLAKLIEGIVAEDEKLKTGLEYRLILTQNLLLNPLNPKVAENFSINAYIANQEALDTFHAQVDAIVAEMEKEIFC